MVYIQIIVRTKLCQFLNGFERNCYGCKSLPFPHDFFDDLFPILLSQHN